MYFLSAMWQLFLLSLLRFAVESAILDFCEARTGVGHVGIRPSCDLSAILACLCVLLFSLFQLLDTFTHIFTRGIEFADNSSVNLQGK